MPPKPNAVPEILLSGKKYRLQQRKLELPDGPLPHWLPAYSEANFQSLTAAERLRDESWPYWLEDWPASWGLASVGRLRATNPAHYPMIDLGCGSGWLACALTPFLMGPYHAVDFNADACRLGALNLRLLNPAEGSVDSTPAASRKPQWIRFLCADAAALPLRIRYRTIFGGEMLYHPDAREAALRCLADKLDDTGTAYFADAGRSPADGFAETLERAGFSVHTEPVGGRVEDSRWRVFVIRRAQAFGVAGPALS